VRSAFFSILIATITVTATAQMDAPVVPREPLVTLAGSVQQRSGDEVRGTIMATILAGWHINSAHPLESFAIPTDISFDPSTADLVRADFPPHVVRSFTFSGGTKLAVYEGTIQISFIAKLKNSAKSIGVSMHYQACNDKVCLPPRNATTTIAANVGPALSRSGRAEGSSYVLLSAAPRSPLPDNPISRTFASSGLLLTLGVLFLAGLALNLTPCVFPMIPITMGFFGMQSDGRRSRRFALAVLYVLGIVVTYSTLGVAAALSGKMIGAWLQQPAVLIFFAALMLVLAAGMFGAWEFTVPQFVANRAMGRAGLAGALTMGLFVGIVAAPCVGPPVVALVGLVAAIGKPLIGLAMFAGLALGLGFPYLVMLNALPKPGEWMVQVKKAMGFVLIAMAVYFLRPLIGDAAFRWGVAASLVIGALFLFFGRSVGLRGGRVMRLSCAALLLVAGAAFVVPRAGGATVLWTPWDPKTIGAAASQHKPVVIDFFADWCLPCKEFDEKTFADLSVASELNRFVRIKADLTNDKDPAVQALTKQYGIVGVPTLIFLDANGQEVLSARLTGFEGPQPFLARLKQVR
jgi:thiol:disulfide interchange protein DsbD